METITAKDFGVETNTIPESKCHYRSLLACKENGHIYKMVIIHGDASCRKKRCMFSRIDEGEGGCGGAKGSMQELFEVQRRHKVPVFWFPSEGAFLRWCLYGGDRGQKRVVQSDKPAFIADRLVYAIKRSGAHAYKLQAIGGKYAFCCQHCSSAVLTTPNTSKYEAIKEATKDGFTVYGFSDCDEYVVWLRQPG